MKHLLKYSIIILPLIFGLVSCGEDKRNRGGDRSARIETLVLLHLYKSIREDYKYLRSLVEEEKFLYEEMLRIYYSVNVIQKYVSGEADPVIALAILDEQSKELDQLIADTDWPEDVLPVVENIQEHVDSMREVLESFVEDLEETAETEGEVSEGETADDEEAEGAVSEGETAEDEGAETRKPAGVYGSSGRLNHPPCMTSFCMFSPQKSGAQTPSVTLGSALRNPVAGEAVVEGTLAEVEEVEGTLAEVEEVEGALAEVEEVEDALAEVEAFKRRFKPLGFKDALAEGALAEVEEVESALAEVEEVESTPAEVEEVESTPAEVEEVESTPAEVEEVESTPAEVEEVESAPAEGETAGDALAKDALAEVEEVESAPAEVEEVESAPAGES